MSARVMSMVTSAEPISPETTSATSEPVMFGSSVVDDVPETVFGRRMLALMEFFSWASLHFARCERTSPSENQWLSPLTQVKPSVVFVPASARVAARRTTLALDASTTT
jgi:hypothetical protein